MKNRMKYAQIPLPIKIFMRSLRILPRRIRRQFPLSSSPEDLSCQPLFIISSGRSGTTLMRSMLAAGGQIAIPPETKIIHTLPVKFMAFQCLGWEDVSRLIISELECRPNFHLWGINMAPVYQKVLKLPVQQKSLAKIIDEVYLSYAAEIFPDAKMWGDQSPIHTFFLPDIIRMFPKAKFLHMLRDGRDYISAMLERYGDDCIHDAIQRWAISLRRVLALRKRVKENQFLEIRYEDLVTTPESILQQVSQFIRVDYTPRMLDFWKLPSTIEHRHFINHKDLGKPIFTSGIGRWREDLSPSQQEIVSRHMSRELRYLGYIR